jgi:hypothetical protein
MDMAKPRRTALPVLLIAALQAGCATSPPWLSPATPEIVAPRCDTSVDYIDLVGMIQNTSSREISFHLDDDRGSPYELWYMGYIVSSAAPGKEFRVVHNSGHDSEWDRTVTIAPGDSATFSIPLFGLRPADYYRYFTIELRDSELRSYWTPVFDLCSFARQRCECPQPGMSSAAPRSCPVVPLAGLAGEKVGAIGVACR